MLCLNPKSNSAQNKPKNSRVTLNPEDPVTLENIEYANVRRLQCELNERFCSSKGNKAVLIQRLKDELSKPEKLSASSSKNQFADSDSDTDSDSDESFVSVEDIGPEDNIPETNPDAETIFTFDEQEIRLIF